MASFDLTAPNIPKVSRSKRSTAKAEIEQLRYELALLRKEVAGLVEIVGRVHQEVGCGSNRDARQRRLEMSAATTVVDHALLLALIESRGDKYLERRFRSRLSAVTASHPNAHSAISEAARQVGQVLQRAALRRMR